MVNAKIRFNLFPGGKKKCVTFSYDDGPVYDYILTEILDRFGAKCTYNLNSNRIDREDTISADFMRELSTRHEIAIHGFNHPFWEKCNHDQLVADIYEDKKFLESVIKKPIIGGAYPYGTYNSEVVKTLDALGIKFCRTTNATFNYSVPNNFLEWHPTCHHKNGVECAKNFLCYRYDNLPVLYIWGHSYEFNDNDNWEEMEEILTVLSESDDIWYATNSEIYDYFTAMRALRVDLNGNSVYNPTATTVYATVDGKQISFPPGLTEIK